MIPIIQHHYSALIIKLNPKTRENKTNEGGKVIGRFPTAKCRQIDPSFEKKLQMQNKHAACQKVAAIAL